MLELPAGPVVKVSIRDAVPMPVAPVVLPVDTMPALPAIVVNQLDGRRSAKLDCGRIGRKWGRLYRYGCHGCPAHKGHDHSAHFSLHRERGGTVGARWLRNLNRRTDGRKCPLHKAHG
jgi:hypothetical protein